MTDRLIETIAAADPARRLSPASPAIQEATRQTILRSDARIRPAAASAAPRAFCGRRLVLVALAAALLVVVIPSAAWAYFSYFGDRQTVLAEFQAAQQQMPLPAGAAWTQPDLPQDAVFGSKMGYIAAWGQSTDAWLREWISAHDARDSAGEQAAIAAVERQIALMPIHNDGDPEESGGFVKESVAFFQSLVDRAKRGDLSGIKDYLSANP
jgi:hypothetical protein